jgi:hypothetical protein
MDAEFFVENIYDQNVKNNYYFQCKLFQNQSNFL